MYVVQSLHGTIDVQSESDVHVLFWRQVLQYNGYLKPSVLGA